MRYRMRQCVSVRPRCARIRLDQFRTVWRSHPRAQAQALAFELGIGGQRHAAAAAEHPADGTFGAHADPGVRMVQGAQPGFQIDATGTDLDGQRALARGGQHVGRRQHAADPLGQPQAFESGGGQHDGSILAGIEPGEPRVEIAAQCPHHESWIHASDLRLTAQAGGADDSARRQACQIGISSGDESVARIVARKSGCQREFGRQVDRHILQRMHRQVGAAFEQRAFQLLDEQTFAADL